MWETKQKFSIFNSQFSVEKLIDILLENRGIKTRKQKEEFLEPPRPMKISAHEIGIDNKELNKAIVRVERAIRGKEKIVVYGDYDADGICATAIVWETLDALGANATPFIPDRFEHGYGLNKAQILKLKTQGVSLIITVDNGIVAYEALEEAKNLGVDVIVSDHHTYEKKPETYAVVHTTQTSGSGVAWFLAREVSRKLRKNTNIGKLELVAIGTIADQLPLTGVNRSLVKYGLEELNKTTRLGLKKLLMVSGLLEKEIGTYEVGFLLAPRINASGRIAQAMDALRLLCTRSSSRAAQLARLLDELNRERQDIVDKAVSLAKDNFPEKPDSVIVMANEMYHEGVIGLIAGKVVERFARPAIVLSVKAEIAKASARSLSGFNIIQAIRAHEELILEGGGHEMAAGFTIEVKNIAKFTKQINKYAKPLLTAEILEKKIKVDTELPFSLVNKKVYNTLKALEPFGIGNPTPLFATREVNIVDQKLVGKGANHLKLVLEKDGVKIDGIFFNRNTKLEGEAVDVCYRLSENVWNGKTSIELAIKDIKNGAKV